MPRLSVPQLTVMDPEMSPSAFTTSGTSTMIPTNTPSSSSEAIVLKASPFWKAHGALRLFRETANQSAFLVRIPPLQRQPPMATVSPSAFASSLKTSPRSLSVPVQLTTLPDASSSRTN